MVVQVFNSGVVSGPETLVFHALPLFGEAQKVVFLIEKRREKSAWAPLEYAKKLGLKVEAIEVNSRMDFKAVRELKELLLSLQPRVVHAHDVKASTYALLASRGAGWKRLSTHHGIEGRPDWITRLYEYFYSQMVLPRMDLVVSVSQGDAATLLQRGHSEEKIRFVANGITRAEWSGEARRAERARLRARWSLNFVEPIQENSVLIGMVARLSAEKRHEYFLRALASLREQFPHLDWRFLAVGNGKLEKELRAKAEALGLASRCLWLGFQENASALVPGFDILALSSQAEGLPIAALEAGWAGTPLFASDVGMLPDLVGSGENAGGMIFPRQQEPEQTAKSLAWMIEHRAEREKFAIQLQNRVKSEFSAEAWVKRMESIYRAI